MISLVFRSLKVFIQFCLEVKEVEKREYTTW